MCRDVTRHWTASIVIETTTHMAEPSLRSAVTAMTRSAGKRRASTMIRRNIRWLALTRKRIAWAATLAIDTRRRRRTASHVTRLTTHMEGDLDPNVWTAIRPMPGVEKTSTTARRAVFHSEGHMPRQPASRAIGRLPASVSCPRTALDVTRAKTFMGIALERIAVIAIGQKRGLPSSSIMEKRRSSRFAVHTRMRAVRRVMLPRWKKLKWNRVASPAIAVTTCIVKVWEVIARPVTTRSHSPAV
jgi:hypothetical protein